MNVFESVKQSVTTLQAAGYYGIKVGRNGMACCIFHDDRTPSMKVDRRYYCFGCGATGDVIDFAAALLGLGKRDAAIKLAEDFGINYEESHPGAKGKQNYKRELQLQSPKSQSRHRRNAWDIWCSTAFEHYAIIDICCNNGKRIINQNQKMKSGIHVLWKHYRKSVTWSISLIFCFTEHLKKRRHGLLKMERG